MPRPLYESDQQLVIERELATLLGKKWQCTARKLPISYGLDYGLVKDGRPIGFMEIKGKPKHSFEEMVNMVGGVPLDLDKMERAANYQNLTCLPFILICAFRDGIYRKKFENIIAESPFDCRFGGREDRGDWQDQEPYLVLAPESFEYLFTNEWLPAND